MINKDIVFEKDLRNKKLKIVRAFEAPVNLVWKAWTESDILDQWWAPHPFKAQTKTMNFKEGGFWLYQMLGTDGEGMWSKENFETITPRKHIKAEGSFCDKEGSKNADFPTMYWDKEFIEKGDHTTVNIEITFDQVEDLESIITMGFKEGFTAVLSNLDVYLNIQKRT